MKSFLFFFGVIATLVVAWTAGLWIWKLYYFSWQQAEADLVGIEVQRQDAMRDLNAIEIKLAQANGRWADVDNELTAQHEVSRALTLEIKKNEQINKNLYQKIQKRQSELDSLEFSRMEMLSDPNLRVYVDKKERLNAELATLKREIAEYQQRYLEANAEYEEVERLRIRSIGELKKRISRLKEIGAWDW